MGWWKLEDSAGVIGDGPVDVFEEGMQLAVESGAKPEIAEFLGSVARALPGRPKELTARFRPPAGDVHSAGASDAALTNAIAEIVTRIHEEYQTTYNRNASIEELLATIAFSLSVHPERFLKGAEGLQVTSIILARPEL